MKTHIAISIEPNHVRTYCGLIRHRWNALNITSIISTVDCKRCLSKMKKEQK